MEFFEARKPRETAVITEIDGVVKYGDIAKGTRKILVTNDNLEREYSLPRGVHVNVQEGETVKAGEPLMDGPLNPHDILAVLGEKELQAYLVNEIQEVYRLQGVNINDKHIEVIVRQMMRWVKIEEVGDTEFLLEEQVDKFRFQEENDRALAEDGKPARRTAVAARHHQSVAVDGFVYLGGLIPGNDACLDGGLDQRKNRLPARLEGKRDHGTAYPCRNWNGLLSQRKAAIRGTTACGGSWRGSVCRKRRIQRRTRPG